MSASLVYVGIGEATTGDDAPIYPNPTTGLIRITSASLENRSFRTTIYNSTGQPVLSSENTSSFDLTSFEAGFYYLTILTSRSEHISKKIILIK